MNQKYLIDKFLIAKFLHLAEDSPAVTEYLSAIVVKLQQVLLPVISDYAERKKIDTDRIYPAYLAFLKQLGGTYQSSLEAIMKGTNKDVNNFFDDPELVFEMDDAINGLYAQVYNHYIPKLSPQELNELNEYIDEASKKAMAADDQFLEELEKAEMEIEMAMR